MCPSVLRGQNQQTYQQKKNSLKERQKETNDPKHNEAPSDGKQNKHFSLYAHARSALERRLYLRFESSGDEFCPADAESSRLTWGSGYPPAGSWKSACISSGNIYIHRTFNYKGVKVMAKKPATRKPHLLSLKPPRKQHPGQGRGRTFHLDRLPPAFHTIKSPSFSQPFQNLPQPTGLPPFRLPLESVLTAEAIQQIHSSGKLVFHTVGDTGGVNTPTPLEVVVAYMEQDFTTTGDISENPSFFYHLGDVVYYAGETQNYYAEFYEPYRHYPAPIFAIPGNHDGDVDPLAPEPSLAAFVRNFCAQSPVHTPEAQDAPRDAMTQPSVYWTLLTEFATIIGLYSNCPEGGQLTQSQIAWFQSELQASPTDKALIVTVHHPVYSAYGPHPGSQHLKDVMDQACQAANRIPDLVLTGHVHDYQRFTAPVGTKDVTFIVAGAGGYNKKLHILAKEFHDASLPLQMPDSAEILEKFCDWKHGYLRVEVTPKNIHGDYFAVPDGDPNQPKLPAAEKADSFDIPL